MITCYYCKGKHELVAQVKDCSTGIKLTLDAVLGGDVNPDPKELLDAWQASNEKINAAFAAKVEIGTIVETVIPATVTKVAVPAHRTSAAYLALKAKIAPQNAGDQFLADVAKLQQIADANPGISIEAGIMKAASVSPIKTIDQQVAEHDTALAVIKKGQDLEIGMYQVTSESGEVIIFKVKWNKNNTYKYAERLWITTSAKWDIDSSSWIDMPKGKFIYANSMMKTLTSEHKMTEVQAKAFHDATKAKYGVDYGFCCVCGKLLTVKKSIDAGIGPVCSSKL